MENAPGGGKGVGVLLTDRETGGRDGGGSTLTPQAKELMEAYLSFRRDAEAELDRLFETYFRMNG